jgi:hypothetical protein
MRFLGKSLFVSKWHLPILNSDEPNLFVRWGQGLGVNFENSIDATTMQTTVRGARLDKHGVRGNLVDNLSCIFIFNVIFCYLFVGNSCYDSSVFDCIFAVGFSFELMRYLIWEYFMHYCKIWFIWAPLSRECGFMVGAAGVNTRTVGE